MDEVSDELTGIDTEGSSTSKLASSRRRTKRKADDAAAVTTDQTASESLSDGDDPEGQTEVIVADIAETRQEMSGTLAALGDRLDPKVLLSDVQERAVETATVVQERAVEAASTVMDQARATMSEAQERAVDTASTVMGQAQETMVVTATTVMDQARDTVHDATVGRVEEMVDTATTTAQETGGTLVRLVKSNPIPAGMASIGLWMLWQKHSAQKGSGVQQRSYSGAPSSNAAYLDYPGYASPSGTGYGTADQGSSLSGMATGAQQGVSNAAGRAEDAAGSAAGAVQDAAANVGGTVQDVVGTAASTVQQAAGGAADTAGAVVGRAGEAVSQMGETANHAVSQLGNTASDLLTDARLAMMRAQEAAGRTMQQNPLAFGATAVAVGAALGLALPSTRKEQELLGSTRDAALERVAEKVEQASPALEQAISEN